MQASKVIFTDAGETLKRFLEADNPTQNVNIMGPFLIFVVVTRK